MAVRNDFAAGEVLAAADLNDTFASKLPYSYGTATPSTTDSGFLWYDSNSTPAAPKFWDGSAFQALTSGKILQVVRATDTTNRTTTSSSFVDANLSVTITPTKTDSAVLLIANVFFTAAWSTGEDGRAYFQIADSSNNGINGANNLRVGPHDLTGTGTREFFQQLTAIGYATPATTSAVTYKCRFSSNDGNQTVVIYNANVAGQLYALEIAA